MEAEVRFSPLSKQAQTADWLSPGLIGREAFGLIRRKPGLALIAALLVTLSWVLTDLLVRTAATSAASGQFVVVAPWTHWPDVGDPTLVFWLESVFHILVAGLYAIPGLLVCGAVLRAMGSARGSIDARRIGARFWTVMGASLLKSLAIGAGFLMLVLPGIWLTGRLLFVQIATVDRGLGIRDAFAESWRLSHAPQRSLVLFLAVFGLTTGIITTAAMAAFLFGPFFNERPFELAFSLWSGLVVTVYSVVQALTYHRLREREASGTLSSDMPPDP